MRLSTWTLRQMVAGLAVGAVTGLAISSSYSGGARAANEPACAAVSPSKRCACDLGALHPLQGAIGSQEVEEKRRAIQEDPDGERTDLANDPIKVVAGPGGGLYVIDHHHGASAWLRAGRADGLCAVVQRPPFATPDAFWAGLRQDNLVRLANKDGTAIEPAQLPATLAAMPDDPYRSLAWRVRKLKGFCRPTDHKEFVEFAWADWYRKRPEPQLVAVKTAGVSESAVALAMQLASSPAAKEAGLPGYVATPPKKCPK